MPTIKVGFVGLSKSGWASTVLAPALLSVPEYSLTAVSTTSKESAEASAQKHTETIGHPVKAYYGNTEQIAKDPDVNFVAVSVKAPSHKEALMPVIEAGKDFFVEWPAGKNTQETIQFAEAVKVKGLRNMVGIQGRQAKWIKKIKEIIESGKIGKVLSSSIVALVPKEGQFWGPVCNARYSYVLTPGEGATMLDIAIGHQLSSVTYVLGDFVSVTATSTILHPICALYDGDKPTGETVMNKIPDHIAFTGSTSSGTLINVFWRAGYPSNKGRQQLLWEIDGEEGSIKVTNEAIGAAFMHVHDPKVYLNGELLEIEESGTQGNIAAAFSEFAKGPEGNYPTLDDAVKLHHLLDAIQTSGETGRRVDL